MQSIESLIDVIKIKLILCI